MSIDGVCDNDPCAVCSSESDGRLAGCTVVDRLTGRQTLVETNVECVDRFGAGIHGVVDNSESDDAKHKLARVGVRRVTEETVMIGVVEVYVREQHTMTTTRTLKSEFGLQLQRDLFG